MPRSDVRLARSPAPVSVRNEPVSSIRACCASSNHAIPTVTHLRETPYVSTPHTSLSISATHACIGIHMASPTQKRIYLTRHAEAEHKSV